MIPSLKKEGVSIIMVAGGIGEYFDVADTVVMMENYLPRDATEKAKEISRMFRSERIREEPREIRIRNRCPLKESINPYVGKRRRVKVSNIGEIRFGKGVIDLSKIEQIVEIGQVRAIAEVILLLREKFSGDRSLKELLDGIDGKVIDILPKQGIFSEPRIFEIGFAINRIRGLRCNQKLSMKDI
ncbi:MAG: hypothetical protein DRN25_06365 [Thermoplasmata archaeon]|nr:MAG: hypothetical protein DRN25_06365 [Thermoplasmata archaeon]